MIILILSTNISVTWSMIKVASTGVKIWKLKYNICGNKNLKIKLDTNSILNLIGGLCIVELASSSWNFWKLLSNVLQCPFKKSFSSSWFMSAKNFDVHATLKELLLQNLKAYQSLKLKRESKNTKMKFSYLHKVIKQKICQYIIFPIVLEFVKADAR